MALANPSKMSLTTRMLLVSIPPSTFFWVRNSSTPLLSFGAVGRLASVVLAHFVIAYIYWSVLYPKFFSPLRNIPHPSRGSFILGHTVELLKEPSGLAWRQWVDEIPHNGMFKFLALFNLERLVVVSPAAVSDVLVHKSYDFEKPSFFRRTSLRVLGESILFAEGDAHRRQRKAFGPAFGFRAVKELYPMFWERSLRLVKAMEEQGEHSDEDSDKSFIVDVGSWTSKATLSIIEEAALGIDTKAIEDPKEPLGLTYRTILSPTRVTQVVELLLIWFPSWVASSLPIKFNRAIKKNESVLREICYAQQRQLEDSSSDTSNLSNTIIGTAISSKQFSTPEIVNQMKTFLIAGHETTATALIWAVYLLTQHPDMQKRLREEVNTSLNTEKAISAAEIDALPYLHAFTSEVLRLYPPVPATIREAARDTSIGSTSVPKGTIVILMPWAVNTSKKAWGPDAQEFKPDRWLNSPNGGAESNYSTLTFLHGPRSCIGERFARGEFACLLAAWVKAFDSELEDPEKEVKIDMTAGITAKPKGGLRVRLTPVQH